MGRGSVYVQLTWMHQVIQCTHIHIGFLRILGSDKCVTVRFVLPRMCLRRDLYSQISEKPRADFTPAG